ncbi:MAG: hypothetical protein ACD_86C00003G0005 [uncultured bacterium]|nr:MAG: hypothetical protein ACD_86C00003G0005 [uncultured bacterium]
MPLQTRRSLAEIIAERKAKLATQTNTNGISPVILKSVELSPPIIQTEEPLNPTTPTSTAVRRKLSFQEMMALRNNPNLNLTEVHAEGIGARNQQQNQQSEQQSEQSEQTEPERSEGVDKPLTATATATATEQNKEEEKNKKHDTFSLSVELNSQQLLAKELAFKGKSFCLTGAAGTGKTTAQREIAKSLLESDCLGTHTFRVQGTRDYVVAPSIAFVAYTRVASGNLRRAIHKDPFLESILTHNVTTIHNLLEYTPETYWNYELNKESFRFVPRRTAANPLDITHLVIEESSMVGIDLWEKLFDALRGGVQIIFIGDINQLQPVFGASILNYGLVQLPSIELTHVYRQAGDSSILLNAHKILRGEVDLVEDNSTKIIRCGTTNYTQAKLSIALGQMFAKWEESGNYNPITDIILSPWNKRDLGTDNMNKWIAQAQGEKRNAEVYQIVAGITSVYLAVGDKVMYNKQVGVITKIAKNGRYLGRAYLPSSTNLTRFGNYTGDKEESIEDLDAIDYSNISLDNLLTDIDAENRVNEASHFTTILLDDGESVELTAIGDYSPAAFSLAYALTVHKAQGCEWRKVFIILHRDHQISLSRELLYTAVTRAREEVCIIAKQDVVEKSIKTQRIKGNTLQDKIEYFNAKIELDNAVKIVK